MPLVEDTNSAAEAMQRAVAMLVDAQYNALAAMEQNNKLIVAAFAALAQAVSAPRKLVMDANGMPVGVEPGE